MIQLEEGMNAPVFEGIDQSGNEIKLSGFRGKKVILYFYPKDNTPGCTAEACNLRDNYDSLLKKGFELLVLVPTLKNHIKVLPGNTSCLFRLLLILQKK